MIISLIVAIGRNREIGLSNKMLWHIPDDFKHFKATTMGHCMVMGRKTFDSIGKALPGRTTIILTRKENYSIPGCIVVGSMEEAISRAKELGETELFIVGGANVYEQGLALCDRIYLSRVDFDGEADTFFPDFEKMDWDISEKKFHEAKDKTPSWSFELLTKKPQS